MYLNNLEIKRKNKIEDFNIGKKVYFHYEDFENYKDLFIENIVLKSDTFE
jgi:hypothetical protein